MFRENILRIHRFDKYESMLCPQDAKAGANFCVDFPGLFKIVRKRYRFENHAAVYSNMLRSEHIPYNFFIPLMLDESNNITLNILNAFIVNRPVIRINDIRIEWHPEPKADYLDDNTAFDVYIDCDGTSGKIGVGIEVKYTEQSYPYGPTEKKRMNNLSSPYHQVTNKCRLYRDGKVDCLKLQKFKQTWRNHLLGEAMVLKGNIKNFYSILLYPSGNSYQSDVVKEYSSLLKPDCLDRFIGLTYETFIKIATQHCPKSENYQQWLDYLTKRYIIST